MSKDIPASDLAAENKKLKELLDRRDVELLAVRDRLSTLEQRMRQINGLSADCVAPVSPKQ